VITVETTPNPKEGLDMKRTLSSLAIATSVLGGTVVGASLVGTAGAYGDAQPAEDTNTQVETLDVQGNGIVPIQDDAPDQPPVDGEDQGRRGHRGGGCNLEEVAEAIGIDVDELRAELDTGSSIADVATANGADVDSVVDAILAEKEDRLDSAVEAGDITEDEADERLADAEERALDRVNRVRGEEAAADA
jgi:hypothetical protein